MATRDYCLKTTPSSSGCALGFGVVFDDKSLQLWYNYYLYSWVWYGSCMQYWCIVCSCTGHEYQSVFLYDTHCWLSVAVVLLFSHTEWRTYWTTECIVLRYSNTFIVFHIIHNYVIDNYVVDLICIIYIILEISMRLSYTSLVPRPNFTCLFCGLVTTLALYPPQIAQVK